MNLNQKIVSIQEQVEVSNELTFKEGVKSGIPLLFCAIFLIPVLFFAIKMQVQLDGRQIRDTDYLMLLISILPLVLWYFCKTHKEISLLSCLYYHLHYVLPKKNERQLEIDEFVKINKIDPNTFITDAVFDNLSVKTLHEWLRVNVSETKSILKLCHQRALTKTNQLDMDFLYWTQLVPKIENVDIYKTLLLTAKFSSYLEFRYAAKFTVSDVTKAFSNYSESDLLRVFTSPMRMRDYIKILNIFQKEKIPFKVEHTLNDLFQGLQYKNESEFKLGHLGKLEIEGFVLEQCLTAVALDDLSNYMKNCLMSRKSDCQKGTSFIYTLNREGMPYIAFELNKRGRLVEAKKRFNQILSSGEKQLVNSIITSVEKRA